MKSAVFCCRVNHADTVDGVKRKIVSLIEASKVLECVKRGDLTAVKIHFGEEGNTGYVNPGFAGVICRHLLQKKAVPFLSDTNTLYAGRRTNSRDHLQLAQEHGFTCDVTGAELDIPDDGVAENTVEVPVRQKHIKTALIALPFVRAQALVGIAHFKGHLLTGFGGALKNIGMGCATRRGKLAQHSDVAPLVVAKHCTACLKCSEVCPVTAVSLKGGKAFIDSAKCVGCASCIAACRFHAVEVDWEAGGARIMPKMMEYAKAVLDAKKGKTAFFNFATRITPECDCMGRDYPSIVPDIGILASADPVAVDKASYDLVLASAKRDIFAEIHPGRDGMKQLEYAARLNLGSLDYKLIEV